VIYTWYPSDGISDIHAFPTKATPLSDKTYIVIAQRSDLPNCFASDSVAISVEIPKFEITLTADTYKINVGSDVTLGIMVQNKGTVTTLPTYINTTLMYIDPSDYPTPLIEAVSDLSISALNPQCSDFLTYKITPTAGKFDVRTIVQTYPFASDSIVIEAEGISYYAQAKYQFFGSFFEIILKLPLSFTTLYTNLNSDNCRLLFSDMYTYVHTNPLQVGLEITEQSDVLRDTAKILKGNSNVVVTGRSDALYFNNSEFTFGLENFMSDNFTLYYSDSELSVLKTMSDMTGNITIIPITYPSIPSKNCTEKADQKTFLKTIFFIFACLGLILLVFYWFYTKSLG